MLDEKNFLKVYGLKEQVVMGKVVLAVTVGKWLLGGGRPKSISCELPKTLSSYMSWMILFCPKEDTLKISS